MKKLCILFSLVLVLAAFASADIYIKSKTHTDAFAVMGQNQPAKDETTEQWMGDDKFAAITPALSIVVDLKKNMLYWINHGNKSYIESPLPFDFTKIVDPQMAQMMSQMMKMTGTVTPTNQTKKTPESAARKCPTRPRSSRSTRSPPTPRSIRSRPATPRKTS